MRGGTLFSGIGAPETAAPWIDWRWCAEIDPFASTVHKARWPHIPNLGDVTAVDWSEVEPVDLVVAGPPCQDHSVAGKRAGLGGERGNLSLVYADILDAIDPLWSLTENVPGWLSLGDNAFGAFLGQLVGADAPLVPGRGQRWTDAGVVDGPRRTAAWRVLDAQFFGVAQRRRRIFVLTQRGAGNRDCAAALFPVVEGLYGDSAPRREARQGAAAAAGDGVEDRRGDERVAPTLDSRSSAGGAAWGTDFLADGGMAAADEVAKAVQGRAWAAHREDMDTLVAGCLQERDHKGSDSDTKPGHLIPMMMPDGGDDANEDVAPTMRAMEFDGSHANGGGQLAVAVPLLEVSARTGREGHEDVDGLGVGDDGDPMYTLQSGHQHGIAYGLRSDAVAYDVTGTPATTGGRANEMNVASAMTVRRLTPREAERLQGFPDDFTLVSYRGKPAADGPRYRALGNSMAVPCVAWLLRRVREVCE